MTLIEKAEVLLPPPAVLMMMLGAIALCTVIEILAPARKMDRPDRPLNLAIGLVFMVLQTAFAAGLAGC